MILIGNAIIDEDTELCLFMVVNFINFQFDRFKVQAWTVQELNWSLFGDCHFQEKDDLEAQFHDVNGKAEHASSQLAAVKQELERTQQQANEALRAIDAERQQLRSANNK